jgi:hypothetical protein
MKALCIRTKMVDGGNSYDVYVPLQQVPQHAKDYIRHEVIRDGRRYMSYIEATVTPEHAAMDQGWEKYEDWKRHETEARARAGAILRRVFPEFQCAELPLLWIDGSHESAEIMTDAS